MSRAPLHLPNKPPEPPGLIQKVTERLKTTGKSPEAPKSSRVGWHKHQNLPGNEEKAQG
jgi:hypothetical protein